MPATSPSSSTTRSGEGLLSLPVITPTYRHPQTVRRSRSGRRRAIVLAVVQLAMIGHVVWWLLARNYGWIGGTTTTPIEPSESMEFVKHGVVNAGLVFFAAALLATLVLGRWFCGWGCHLVLLQDLCGWIMRKCGIRPKPFRSRLLIYVPLVLALYMFVWPAVYRWGYGFGVRLGWIEGVLPAWELQWHLTTTEFWRTFPGVLVAIPFLAICGFAAVYFLGSKGFCTYGCPYGGFFAPVDRLAPGRIRVTDDCEHCGHCTAVCTSNVRVHEEVREYGMVVDPGCMKCLDCVSVCPNDALYFGYGRPALGAKPRGERPSRNYDLSWPEEIGLAVVFLLTFISVRGVYGLVPMLMAVGVAGCVTFLVWKLWKLVRVANVSFNRTRLKYRGALSTRGKVFAAVALLAAALTIHSGFVNAAYQLGGRYDDRIVVGREAVLADPSYEPTAQVERHASAALTFYGLASGLGQGGIGLPAPWQANIDMRRAWLHAARGDLASAESVLSKAMKRDGVSDRFTANLADIVLARGDDERALSLLRTALLEERSMPRTLEDYAQRSVVRDRIDEALEVLRARRERFPDDLETIRWTALLQLESGDLDTGIATMSELLERAPDDIDAWRTIALAHARARRFVQALETTQLAIERAPERVDLHLLAARLLVQLGRPEIARRALARANELAPDDPHVQAEIAELSAFTGG